MGQGDNDDHGDENGANASDVAWIAAWTAGHLSTNPNESCRSPIASRARDSPFVASLSRRVGELGGQCKKSPKPKSTINACASFLHDSVRFANICSCCRKPTGGPLRRKSGGGARMIKRSWLRVALDNIT